MNNWDTLTNMEQIDLLVIGAGLHGLIASKTYAESVPHCKILILDSAASIGGVWARERLYAGLKTNNVVGSYEFSDFPMDMDRYKIKPGQHIPGLAVHQYLVDFADHFNLTRKIQLKTKVDTITLGSNGIWRVEYSIFHGSDTLSVKKGFLMARNIAVATGLTSEPRMPTYPGQDGFKGRLFHARQLNSQAQVLQKVNGNVVVVGANKSAWDVCYMAAQLTAPEATIHMVIRPSGRGPSWMWRRRGIINFLSISRLTSTRLFTWFDPSPLASPLQRFFLTSWLGRLVCTVFWALLDYLVLSTSGYLLGQGELRRLQPWFSTFWMGNSLSIHNYETDWFDFVREGKIVVHYAEVEAFTSEDKAIRLSDGQVLKQVDVVVACTGWEYTPNIRFTPPLALLRSDIKGIQQEEDHEVSQALKLIGGICPAVLTKKDLTKYQPPYRLYRFIAPLDSRLYNSDNIAFIGFYQSVHTTLVAQAQALWMTAFFQHAMALPLPDIQTCRKWTYLNTEYQQLRRLGSPFPSLLLDVMPYIDLLLADLGLASSRKRNWWKDLVEPNRPGDYRGLVEECIYQVDTGN
jgi:thioredoxin reductase